MVQEEHYLTGVARYIHRNPLKARMVNRVKDYKWSSHKDYLKGKSKEEWLDIDPILMSFSRNRSQAVEMWEEFVEQCVNDEITKFYSRKNQSSILGEESFVKGIKERFIYSHQQLNVEIKEKKGIQGEGRIEKINHEVCRYFKISKEHLFFSSRGEENIQRQIAISLTPILFY